MRTLAEVLDAVGFVAGPVPVTGAPILASDGASPAISQPHCHQQAVLGLAADRRVMERNGIAVGRELTGCCGLAGNFGAERGHEAIVAGGGGAGPAAGPARPQPRTPLLADGFSCRTQIESLSGRRARHLAEVLAERLPLAPDADGRGS